MKRILISCTFALLLGMCAEISSSSVATAQDIKDIVGPLLSKVNGINLWVANDAFDTKKAWRYGLSLTFGPLKFGTFKTEKKSDSIVTYNFVRLGCKDSNCCSDGYVVYMDTNGKNVTDAAGNFKVRRVSYTEKDKETPLFEVPVVFGYQNVSNLVHNESAFNTEGFQLGSFFVSTFFSPRNFLFNPDGDVKLSFGLSLSFNQLKDIPGTYNNPAGTKDRFTINSQSTLAVEPIVSLVFFKHFFLDVCYQHMIFNSLTYTPEGTGVTKEQLRTTLPNSLDFSKVYLKLGVSLKPSLD